MDKVAELLGQLAAKLGTTVEHLWPILVAQAKVEAAWELGVCVTLTIVAAILVAVYAKRPWFAKDPTFHATVDNPTPAFFVWLGSLLTLVFSSLGLIANGGVWLGVLMNPEYGALKMLLRMVRG